MKKLILALFTLMLSSNIVIAAPINNLSSEQTALGFGTDSFYLEHKFTPSFTLGFQNLDWNGNDDIYGQFNLSENLRGIIGNRNFDSGSEIYLGMAVTGPLAPKCDGYASIIAGSSFKEFQAGANFKLTTTVDLNVNYHSYMPDVGKNKTGVGLGATFKF
ncbi:MAG: hypothetical protein H6Q73_3001 [Firmicutes bacterium]|nr:hypothetical protein [Bacillota bacterium]